MDFFDKIKVSGHLQIIKKMKDTGKEEILFDDHNVITGGLGRSIAQFMSLGGCVPAVEPCVNPTHDVPLGGAADAHYGSGGSSMRGRLPKTTSDWTRHSPPVGPGTGGEPEGGAGLSMAASGLGNLIPCYCIELLKVSGYVKIFDDHYSTFLNVLYGAGCRDDEDTDWCNRDAEDSTSEIEGGYFFSFWTCKLHGDCPGVPEDAAPNELTDPCQFVWGMAIGTGTGSDTGEGTPPPQWAQDLKDKWDAGPAEENDFIDLAASVGTNYPDPATVADACKQKGAGATATV